MAGMESGGARGAGERALGWFARLALGVLPKPSGTTRLIQAARAGEAGKVRALATAQSAKETDHWGRSALAWAACEGGPECVKALLGLGDTGLGEDGWSPLMAAAQAGRLDCVELLLPHSDAAAAGAGGLTALMCAARGGSAECVRALLGSSDPLARDARGRDALMWAARSGSEEAAAVLLPWSDASRVDGRGMSALMWAASEGRSAEGLVRLLLPESEAWQEGPCAETAASLLERRGAKGLGEEVAAAAVWQKERAMVREATQAPSAQAPKRRL